MWSNKAHKWQSDSSFVGDGFWFLSPRSLALVTWIPVHFREEHCNWPAPRSPLVAERRLEPSSSEEPHSRAVYLIGTYCDGCLWDQINLGPLGFYLETNQSTVSHSSPCVPFLKTPFLSQSSWIQENTCWEKRKRCG